MTTTIVRCIDKEARERQLTYGKAYEVLGPAPDANGYPPYAILILNDEGDVQQYFLSRFEVLEDTVLEDTVTNKAPHIHAAAIHAYADGEEIEWRIDDSYAWAVIWCPSFRIACEYRVKCEKNPRIEELQTILFNLAAQRLKIAKELKDLMEGT